MDFAEKKEIEKRYPFLRPREMDRNDLGLGAELYNILNLYKESDGDFRTVEEILSFVEGKSVCDIESMEIDGMNLQILREWVFYHSMGRV